MKKQHILFVVGKLDLVGGAETLLYSLIASLKNSNSNYIPEVLVVAGHSDFEKEIKRLGVPVHILKQYVPPENLKKTDIQHVLHSQEKAHEILEKTGTIGSLNKPDIVVGMMSAANVSASSVADALAQHMGKKIPVVWTQHDTDPGLYISPELLELSKELSSGVSCVVCQPSSKEVYEKFIQRTFRLFPYPMPQMLKLFQ
jgi:hypothetical protein